MFQGLAFKQAVGKAIESGGRLYFNLTGLDIQEALVGDPDLWVGRYTAWELQQIVRSNWLFSHTSFYLGGEELSVEQLRQLGIEPPTVDAN